MEDGEKVNIPLDSGLDVHSSDMLVPVSEPKFQHNRQRFQGKYLPSSVRFEHDGWAAGDDVYQFEVEEAYVVAGDYRVSKQNINSNPTYRLVFKSQLGKQLGSLYYIKTNSLKQFTTGSDTAVSYGINPVITGSVNGKQFRIEYDSLTSEFRDMTPDEYNLEITGVLCNNYMTLFSVKDRDMAVSLSFGGMRLPTGTLLNDVGNDMIFEVGKFAGYSEDTGFDWLSGTYTLRVSGDGRLTLLDSDGGVMFEDDVDIDADGGVSKAFMLPVKFYDSPQVTVNEFYPYFSNISVSQLSQSVQGQASDKLPCNKWYASATDLDHNGEYNSSLLYRNSHVPEGVTDYSRYNRQTITYTLPVWFGVSCACGFIDDYSGHRQLSQPGSTYGRTTRDIEVGRKSIGWKRNGSGRHSYYRYYYTSCVASFRTTEGMYVYDGCMRRPNITVWEGTEDKTDSYMTSDLSWNVDSDDKVTLRVYFTYTWEQTTSSNNRDEYKEARSSYFDFYLPAAMSNMLSISLRNIDFTGSTVTVGSDKEYEDEVDYEPPEWPSDVKMPEDWGDGIPPVGWLPPEGFEWPNKEWEEWYEEYTAATEEEPDLDDDLLASAPLPNFVVTGTEIVAGQKTVSVDFTGSPFCRDGSVMSFTCYGMRTVINASNMKLRGEIDDLGENVAYDDRYVSTLSPDGYNFWGRCCLGKVAGAVYVATDGTLDKTLDASAFGIVDAGVSTGNKYVDLSDMFKLQLTNASCVDKLNMTVYVCSRSYVQGMFSVQQAPMSTDSTLYIMPGHIKKGELASAGDTNAGNMNYFTINRSYKGSTIDINYGMTLTVTGTPVMSAEDMYFDYISEVGSVVDTSGMLPGSKFSNETVHAIVSSLEWDVSDWYGWVDVNDASATKDVDFFKGYGQKVTLRINNQETGTAEELHMTYGLCGEAPELLSDEFYWADDMFGYDIGVSVAHDAGSGVRPIKALRFEYATSVLYSLTFNVPHVLDSNFSLLSLVNNVGELVSSDGLYLLDIDFDMLQVKLRRRGSPDEDFDIPQECDEEWGDNYSVSLYSEYVREIYAALCGVYKVSGVEVTSLTSYSMKVMVDGKEVQVNLLSLFDNSQESKVRFLYTRVNDPVLGNASFAEMKSDDEMQFLKQQWDTTNATENFWWINNDHVLVLTKSEFVLRGKTEEVSDWAGDVFCDKRAFPRIDYATSDVAKYFCTCAYGGQRARLVTVRERDGAVGFDVYDFLDQYGEALQAPTSFKFDVGMVKHSVTKEGEYLCTDTKSMHTYSDIQLANLVSKSVWTATCVGHDLIIGCHFDGNFNQWAIVYNLDTSDVTVMQGYGFVGADGSLTGGEIPSKYYAAGVGFSGAVRSLDALNDGNRDIVSLSELYLINDMVVGSDTQQWYISKSIASIVSHLSYNDGVFSAQHLPLNNNYSVDYASASYASVMFSDYDFKIRALKDLLPDAPSAWTVALALWLWPMLYYLDPRITTANYMQQTLGQASYVHYNATNTLQQKDTASETYVRDVMGDPDEGFDAQKQKSPLSVDEISFDRQSVRQTQKTDDPYTTPFTMCAAALVSAADFGMGQLQVNHRQNQTSVGDMGKQYSQYFMQNLNSMAIADMDLQAVNPSQTSEVTAIKSLDMFYSTSDKQQVYAGAGYVQHNFVAQCVTQSVTSLKSAYRQQKLLYVITPLTLLPLQQTLKGLEVARDAVVEQLRSMGGPGITFGGVVAGLTFTTPVSIALGIAWAALAIACNIMQIGCEVLPQMITALGGNKLNSSITAKQTKGDYQIESKHKYGASSKSFMWPCFGVDVPQKVIDESVQVTIQNKSWKLAMPIGNTRKKVGGSQPAFITSTPDKSITENFDGDVPYYIAMIKGAQSNATLPERMAYVLGTESFLPCDDFKNENISESEPVFGTPSFQDYVISDYWQLSRTASSGITTWIGCKDTKIIDGDMSNCVISDDFCGVASPYTAIEVKRGVQEKYMRPWAITPQVLALNNTGLNCCFEEKAYHAFDGYGYRVINWAGAPGIGKEKQSLLYAFLVNDRFKRSNKLPPNEYYGNFQSEPTLAIKGDYNDKVYSLLTQPGEKKGMSAGVSGEDKSARRYSVPVFSEFVSTLPAAVKTVAAQVLSVVEGVTSLVTVNRNLNTAYKAPVSVDFTLGKSRYRYTQEYICSLTCTNGVDITEDVVPCLGMTFIGSTPYEAYLYSQATKQYYVFTGGSSLAVVGMVERFRDVVNGRYDFINQEVLMPCLATFDRLDVRVRDDEDETDNVIVPRIKDRSFAGEVWPPLDNIYNTRSWFRTLSLPCGVTYQGPNRCIVNRFITQDYMYGQIKDNYGKWRRVPREVYHPFRKYADKYSSVEYRIGEDIGVNGWTHNPFLLVTAPLGVSYETDCLFEWEVTLCWPVEMDRLYGPDSYAVVNIQAETMTPGGKVVAERPVHVFLTKELFTRTGNYGYYSFRYQSKCGAGNRERLHIWSDQYICVSSLQCEYKVITGKRTEILTEQLDVSRLKEV